MRIYRDFFYKRRNNKKEKYRWINTIMQIFVTHERETSRTVLNDIVQHGNDSSLAMYNVYLIWN